MEKIVYAKKLMFFRSICMSKENDTCRRILRSRTIDFQTNTALSKININDSPFLEILKVAERAGVLDICCNMVLNNHFYDKTTWRKMVWEKLWALEDEETVIYRNQLTKEKLFYQVTGKSYYLTWWVLSDLRICSMEQSGIMARLVCDASLLKATDIRLKKGSFASKWCTRCDLGICEDIWHVVMQCPYFEHKRALMHREIIELNDAEIERLFERPQDVFYLLMGRHPENIELTKMAKVWVISAKYIVEMYKQAITGR